MKISKNFIEKVLNATDIVELISDHRIVLKKTGVNFKGLCPFHSEKTPSFNVMTADYIGFRQFSLEVCAGPLLEKGIKIKFSYHR